ncbi:MAG: hypothetical protein AAF282_07165 [Cyanobacteria bacterium P01_A01_bin.15]
MLPQQPSPASLRHLWLTCDFSASLPTATDPITPQLFLKLMAHPAINQIKRFTQSEALGPDDVAAWAPGIFTMQVYRSSVPEALLQVTSMLAQHLDTPEGSATITVYTQLGGRHYPITTRLSPEAIGAAAQDIETMVCQHEKG